MNEKETPTGVNITEILERHAQAAGVTKDVLVSKNKASHISQERARAQVELSLNGLTYSEIGEVTNQYTGTIRCKLQDFRGNVDSGIRDMAFTQATIAVVAEDYGVEQDQMASTQSRFKFLAQPRKTAQFILHKGTDLAFLRISNIMGRSDHTTAMHAIETVEVRMEHDEEFRERVEGLFEDIKFLTDYVMQESV